jgi:hypothetical protein
MRNLLTIILLFFTHLSFSQAISYRYITPVKGHGQEFRNALGEKTKKYNSKEDEP